MRLGGCGAFVVFLVFAICGDAAVWHRFVGVHGLGLEQLADPFGSVYLVGPEPFECDPLVFELLGELLVQIGRLWFLGRQ